MNKKVLVTGAGGFIGSHLVEQLVRKGFNVRALIHYNSNNSIGNLNYLPDNILDEVEIVFGDITSIESINKVVKNCNIIYNLAALISVPYSYQNPRSFFKVNLEGTLNLFNSANDCDGIDKIIQMSSSEVYGTPQYTPIDEKHPYQPQSPYAASKVSSDALAESFYKTYGTPVTVARPFNTYGPRQSNRAIIPTIISQALLGNEINLGNIDALRDFNYVTDTVFGLMTIATEVENAEGESINIGSGNFYSIKSIIDIVSKILNENINVNIEESRLRPSKSEVKELLCNNEKIHELTNWKSKISLYEGIEKTINFIKINNPQKKNNIKYFI